MRFFVEIYNNIFFRVAFFSWLIAQLLKFILALIIDRDFNIERFYGAGGFPSSHTASMLGVSTAIGIKMGFDSGLYALALVMSFIVMYDASGVRRAVGKQAKIINNMLQNIKEYNHFPNDELKELIGHTPFEVIGGALLGILVANLLT